MNRTSLFQAVRVVAMIAAIAGVIYAVEYMEGTPALWCWVALLGVGFVGLLWSFRITRRRLVRDKARESRKNGNKNRKTQRR